ncbi:MAG: serine O-acetyltransferase EpsC [Bacilli bacterium]|jgi:serine O-acetyltransferase|nr:serine O-acetyltransferase EpsC [Bacilli bacterium]
MELIVKDFKTLPNQAHIADFLNKIRNRFFPNYFIKTKSPKKCDRICKKALRKCLNTDHEKIELFFDSLPRLKDILLTDIEMTFNSDPACESKQEIVLTYPGFYAIFVHRIAHELYKLNIPLIPRMMSEIAHSKTGIDIHPGANIGPYFFIDHGTGIVIGETAIIGHHVKIYQGVTLGAISLSAGRKMRGEKRHPTVGNYVTIYAGASILGGETNIGDKVTIGSNVFITHSIAPNMRVINKEPELVLKGKDSI